MSFLIIADLYVGSTGHNPRYSLDTWDNIRRFLGDTILIIYDSNSGGKLSIFIKPIKPIKF
jgi:hypothetical protein